MEENRASRTAMMTAYSRGYHAAHDHPRIFDDFLAYRLLTEDERTSVETQLMTSLRTFNPASAASFPDHAAAMEWMMQAGAAPAIVFPRAQYAEESLEKAVELGVRQYVILGAGLDTFAFRRPELMESLQVYEVDHPATQSYKRQRLTDLGWELPESLHFVPLDFMLQSLTAALTHSSLDPRAPTFFSWLGVTYYLTRDVVFATLRDIADVAPTGSSLIFDYLDTDAFVPRKAAPRVLRMLRNVQELGEPMLAGFDPFTLAAELTSLGLRLDEDLSPWDIQERYFMGRTDHYRACEHAHLAHATVY